MATMTTPPAPRRGSFLETWRLFSTGAGKVWATVLIICTTFAMPLAFVPHGRPLPLLFYALMVVTVSSFVTWHFEGEQGDRLAFMAIVAQPVDTRRLVLVPMCLIGLVLAIASVAFTRLPAVAALSLLGMAWWTIAATRWLWRLRFWSLIAWPIALVGPALSYGIYYLGARGAAGAVSLALGIGALAFQPRPYVGEPLSRLRERGRAVAQARTRRTPHKAISVSGESGAGWLASAGRFMRLSFGGYDLIVITSAFSVLVGLIPFTGRLPPVLIWAVGYLGFASARAYSGDMHEFLRTRPFDSRSRFVGGVLGPLLIILLAPATALCFVDLHWIETGGLFGLIWPRPPREDEVRYLRDILGATFLPEKWPAGGLPQHLWAQLRPILYLDVLRLALMFVSLFFAVPIWKAGEGGVGRRPIPPGTIVIFLIILGVLIRVDFSESLSRWPLPRLWFLALLAAASIAHWVWRVRAASAPARS